MRKSPIVILGVLMLVGLALAAAPATQPDKTGQRVSPFLDNVKVVLADGYWLVNSDGIPNHKTAVYPNRDNPNRIIKQDYHFKIPLNPKMADKITPLPMGPIGVAINGIPFYNPYNAQGRDAVSGQFAEVFDSCCGHPDARGRYHYHKYPTCVNSPFKEEAGKPSPLLGYAFDGFPIYGPNCKDGKPAAGLDECNGHVEAGGLAGNEYHYHVTSKFPYILGGYHGLVERSNFDHGPGGPGGGPRGPGDRPGPPPGPPPQ